MQSTRSGSVEVGIEPLVDAVRAPMSDLRARIQAHGGDLRVTSVDGQRVEVKFLGACQGCVALPLTFLGVVKPRLEAAIGEGTVTCSQVTVSRHASDRIASLWAETSGSGRAGRLAEASVGLADGSMHHASGDEGSCETSQPSAGS